MKINIDISSIEEIISSLNKTIEEYHHINDNIFNTLKDSSFFWNDNISKKFYSQMEIEERKNEKLIINLESNRELVKYIVNSYSTIGKKIRCNLNSKDTIIRKINEILNELNSIINLYNNLNTSFCPYESYLLYNEKRILCDIRDLLKKYLNNIEDKFRKIEQIENNIKNKISKLNTFSIEEFNDSLFIGK